MAPVGKTQMIVLISQTTDSVIEDINKRIREGNEIYLDTNTTEKQQRQIMQEIARLRIKRDAITEYDQVLQDRILNFFK